MFYYEQKDPIYHALLVFFKTVTIFGLVIRRFEFWVFLGGHCSFLILFRMGTWNTGDLSELKWEAVSATQMFMVFLLTFFNGHCYNRYMYLYDLCMDVMDGINFFVQELVISMSPPSVENHRVRAVKYTLALLHIFFVGLTGRMKKKSDWKLLVQRGLLTRLEAEQLQNYPSQSIETVLVLSTWAMQIIDKGLEDDAFWTRRSMRIAHTHNRLQLYMNDILRSIHEIGDVCALPLPFPYFHVMNVVLLFNLLVLCVLTASFQTYQTVFPMLVSILFFLGLREVAAALADPFNGQDSDFPIHNFLQSAFDNSVCLLEAFRHGDSHAIAARLLERTTEFTDPQLRHVVPNYVLYNSLYDPILGSPFSWNREYPLSEMMQHHAGPHHVLTKSKLVTTVDDWMVTIPKEEEKQEEAKPPKKSVVKRFCEACIEAFCGGKQAVHVQESIPEAMPPLVRAEERVIKTREKNNQLQETVDSVQKKYSGINNRLMHQLKVGRELGLPVDEWYEAAIQKNKGHDYKMRQAGPEFTTFDEARTIVNNARYPNRSNETNV
jgi:predicted membrane chloride channel (bestrophin family)